MLEHYEPHIIIDYDINLANPIAVYFMSIMYCPIMEHPLFLVPSNVVNVKGVCDFIFAGSNSAIIFDRCIHIGI